MANLCFKVNNSTKTLSCLPYEAGVPKPYIRVNTSGYLPLTTQTSTGIKVQINGVEYSPAKSTFITMSTTITQNFIFHKGDLGETKSSSWTTQYQNGKGYRAYSGGIKVTEYYGNETTYSQNYSYLPNGGYKLGVLVSGTEDIREANKYTIQTSDSWWDFDGSAEFYIGSATRINASMNGKMGPFGLPINFRYSNTASQFPFIIVNENHVNEYNKETNATVISKDSGTLSANLTADIHVFYQTAKNAYSEGCAHFLISSSWTKRALRTSANLYNLSQSLTYMSKPVEGITDYGRIIQSDTISHCTSIATTTSTFGGIATKETVFSILQTGDVRCDGARRSTARISRLNNGAQRVYSTYSTYSPTQIGFNATNTYILSSETYGINSYVTNFDLAYVFTTENGKGINIHKIQSQSVLNGTNTYYYSSSTYEYYNNATFTECISTSYTGSRFPCNTVVLYYSDRVINTNSTYFVDTASPTTIYFTYTAITTQQRNIYI